MELGRPATQQLESRDGKCDPCNHGRRRHAATRLTMTNHGIRWLACHAITDCAADAAAFGSVRFHCASLVSNDVLQLPCQAQSLEPKGDERLELAQALPENLAV